MWGSRVKIDPNKINGVGRHASNTAIHFHVGGNEMLRLEPNGDIYVRGELADNDSVIVDGLREFVFESKKLKKGIRGDDYQTKHR